jgi:hypothetical protein
VSLPHIAHIDSLVVAKCSMWFKKRRRQSYDHQGCHLGYHKSHFRYALEVLGMEPFAIFCGDLIFLLMFGTICGHLVFFQILVKKKSGIPDW